MILLDSVLQNDTMHSAMDTTVQTKVTTQMRRQLEKLAAQERRTVSNYLRLLIEQAIEASKADKESSQSNLQHVG